MSMLNAGDAYNLYNVQMPDNVLLLAVSKHHPIDELKSVYDAGCRCFGENKVQELVNKYEALPKDINWHFIGHLQTNKVKYISSFITLIHGVDSLKLLAVIDKEAKKCNRIIHCLLQIKIANEDSKFGLSLSDVDEIVADIQSFANIRVVGLMGMATNTDDENQVRSEFRELKCYFEKIKSQLGNPTYFTTLSMGMSDDFKIAIEEGSTLIRMGTSIFGNRTF